MYWAGGFFYNPRTQSVLLHERDGKTKFNPNKWAFFGGTQEPGDVLPIATFRREIKEELGIDLIEKDVRPLFDYLNVELKTHRYVFYTESALAESALILNEGKSLAWIPLERVFDYDLTDMTAGDLRNFMNYLTPDKQENPPETRDPSTSP